MNNSAIVTRPPVRMKEVSSFSYNKHISLPPRDFHLQKASKAESALRTCELQSYVCWCVHRQHVKSAKGAEDKNVLRDGTLDLKRFHGDELKFLTLQFIWKSFFFFSWMILDGFDKCRSAASHCSCNTSGQKALHEVLSKANITFTLHPQHGNITL